MRISLSIVSLNARGLRNITKRKALFLFVKQLNTEFSFCQESHSNSKDENFWRSQWGNDLWFSHCSERSAGVLTLKHKYSGDILHTDTDPKGHFICQVVDYNKIVLIIFNIYGYNSSLENIQLFANIENRLKYWLKKFPNSHILLGGDFNITLNSEIDRWPPTLDNNRNAYFKLFMDRYDLIDIWRVKFPDEVSFTWSNKDNTRLSRIDFWLVSKSIKEQDISVNILPCPLSDHKAVFISIKLFSDNDYKANYWKLNNSLLKVEEVNQKIPQLIKHFFNKAVVENSFSLNWELFKYESAKYFRKLGSKLAKIRKLEEQRVITGISVMSQISPDTLTEEEKIEMLNLQESLDNIYKKKAEGAFIRSRKRWLEEGEQNSAYFFKLEKYDTKMNTINELKIGNSISDDQRVISDFCSSFYKKLYTSEYADNNSSIFINSLHNTPKLDNSERDFCDLPLSLAEVTQCLELLKDNKSPGTDGQSSEFYKLFSQQMAPFLLQVFNESIKAKTLPWSMTQGLITLLPKPCKDLLYIDNWRPISLLNNDYKILALIFARRIKKSIRFYN